MAFLVLIGVSLAAEESPEVPVPPIRTGLAPMAGPDDRSAQAGLPDPLVDARGKPAVTVAQFEQRRNELIRTLEYYAVGSMPPAPGNLRGEVVRQAALADGAVHYELVRLTFGPPAAEGFDLAVFRPAGDGPFPVFIHPSFGLTPGGEARETMPRRPEQGHGRDALRLPLGIPGAPPAGSTGPAATPSEPAEVARAYASLFARGYALAIYHYQDTGEDTIARNPDGSWAFRNTRFVAAYPDQDWGLLGCWAWGISRCVDYLAARPYADAGRLIAIGHSRLGKAVLVAGAFDQRLAMVVPAGTAGGGVGAYRFCGLQDAAETLDVMVRKYPNWFSPRLRSFSGRTDRLPFDQHWFIALTAPRAFLALEGIDDRICSPRAVRESIEAAQPVYALHGASAALGVHYADHGHALTMDDWGVAMDFADRVLRNREVDGDFTTFPDTAYPNPGGQSHPATTATAPKLGVSPAEVHLQSGRQWTRLEYTFNNPSAEVFQSQTKRDLWRYFARKGFKRMSNNQ